LPRGRRSVLLSDYIVILNEVKDLARRSFSYYIFDKQKSNNPIINSSSRSFPPPAPNFGR